MIVFKPKFWDKKKGLISILLFPLSILFLLLIFLKKKFTKIKIFKIPIICVGNIYIGGTGKTPTSIFLARELYKLGKKPCIIRKYYKSHNDEYNLINNSFGNLILNKDRVNGLREAEKSKFDIAILDDGLQDNRIKKNISIVCFNQNQLIGNGFILPAGPLRERLSSLSTADIIIINGDKDRSFEEKLLDINNKLEIFYSSYKPINLDEFKNKKLIALAGIGNPENFFELIKKNDLKIEKKLIFPDHYRFSKDEIQNIINKAKKEKYEIIMTEKDYFKIKNYKIDKLKYLKVVLEIKNQEKLLNKIKELNDKSY